MYLEVPILYLEVPLARTRRSPEKVLSPQTCCGSSMCGSGEADKETSHRGAPLESHTKQSAFIAHRQHRKQSYMAFCDGGMTRSLGTLLRRAEEALTRLQALSQGALIHMFSRDRAL